MNTEEFLGDIELRPLSLSEPGGMEPVGLAVGPGSGGLEVAVARAPRRPGQETMRNAWKARHGGRAAPVLLVTMYGDRAAFCGPGGDSPPVFFDLDVGQVDRICRAALAEPNRHAAARFLAATLPEVKESRIPGLRNVGLFATHELEIDVPRRSDWSTAQQKSEGALDKRGRDLLAALGYQVEDTNQQYSILRCGQTRVGVALFLDRSEASEIASDRFGGMTPIQYALAKADDENLEYVLVDHGSSLRIHTATGQGVGRRGRTETYVEIHLDLLPNDRLGYLWLLFSGSAISRNGTFSEILERSYDYASDLGERLRDRIYEFVVPDLALGIAQARNLKKPTAQDLQVTYEMALLVLFRLLFVAYAEDKDLLPYRTNERYRGRSLKQKARELAEMREQGQVTFDDSTSHWDEAVRLFQVVDTGRPKEWGVPGYNGGLFSEEPGISPAGAQLCQISLTNRQFGPVLLNLLVAATPEGVFGPVDFRSLGVRNFGTIYEGLLESELSVAEEDLVVDKAQLYVPAGKKEPDVRKGQTYLHNASGARKATGSYYTKSFAVEHLLDHSLEPALVDHLARLDERDDRRAAESFFDFRVADIAMGSGHFLVAAVDRIERRMSSYLAKRPLPGVLSELRRLGQAAVGGIEAAGGTAEGVQIENGQLLRRQIARRCIYGVDINEIAVQLARLSLWIHTFVPGLPLSFLDHNVVCGNSLVGIATFDEVRDLLEHGRTMPLFDASPDALLGDAEAAVKRLAQLSDADAAEIKAARKAFAEQRHAVAPTERLFDILTASRLPDSQIDVGVDDFEPGNELIVEGLHRLAERVLGELEPFHFPIAFPEVFLRARAGFDVILGNPPWEKPRIEEHAFWARYQPGLRGLSQVEREPIQRALKRQRPDLVEQYERELAEADALRNVLTNGPFPGMGTGDPDLYKAFCWRFWNLVCRAGGRMGVVLPRSALCAKGSSQFRTAVFAEASADIAFLVNNGQWVFPEVHPQYTIGLTCITKGSPAAAPAHDADGGPGVCASSVSLRGPFPSLERFLAGVKKPPVTFPASDVSGWTDTAALPLLPAEASALTFAQLRKAPRLDLNDGKSWRARPYRELDATNDKKLMNLVEEQPKGYWPVFKGESFDIWEPDRGVYYAWADPEKMIAHLHKKRCRGQRNSNSPFFEFPGRWFDSVATLPSHFARIAFRDVSRATDSRTVRAALVPPKCFLVHLAPTLVWPRGDETHQAFLLGVLSSIPLDWY
ncbi:MAG: hypothetical protein ABIP48_32800, partial [Planctomycetota bacterium]